MSGPLDTGTIVGIRLRVETLARFMAPDQERGVLQVRVRYSSGPNDRNGLPLWLAGEGWRDARSTDILVLAPFLSS